MPTRSSKTASAVARHEVLRGRRSWDRRAAGGARGVSIGDCIWTIELATVLSVEIAVIHNFRVARKRYVGGPEGFGVVALANADS